MRTKSILAFSLLCMLLTAAAVAEKAGFDIQALSFITGTWHGELFGGKADETWTAPRDGTMMGVFRLTWDDGRRLYELLLVEEKGNGEVEMVFRHFDEGMGLWEREIEKPNRFRLAEAGENFAVFEAPDRSQEPALFRFELDPVSDRLKITVASLDGEGKIRESFEAVYARVVP